MGQKWGPVPDIEVSSNTECSYCGGFGFVHPMRDGRVVYGETIPCSCTKAKREAERKGWLIKGCKLPPFTENMTFANFKLYPELKLAYSAAKSMAEHPGDLSWLGFIGHNGTGKTHLAVSICKAWIEAGIASRYAFVSILLDELRRGFAQINGDLSYEERFSYYCNIPLLLLDDYGVESATPWVQEKLDTIVDYRLMNNLSLIVTSNKDIDDMPKRVASRLIRHPKSQVIEIVAPDFALRRK